MTTFARMVDVDPSWLSRIERDQGNPSPEVQRRIADAFGVAITEIAEHEEKEDR